MGGKSFAPILFLAALLLTAMFIAAIPASAGTAQVSGSQFLGGPCPEFTMDGSLVGCWFTDDSTVKVNPSGTVQVTGHEHFDGCLDGLCGTLNFAFTFTGKFEGPPTFAEIHGRCHHVIVSGTGAFAGASGVIDFKDDVSTGIAYYKGHIKA